MTSDRGTDRQSGNVFNAKINDKDNAGPEELSTCFRFLNDEGRIEERFYDLTRLKEADAQTIVNEFCEQLKNWACPPFFWCLEQMELL